MRSAVRGLVYPREARPAYRSFCAWRTVMRYQDPDSVFQISSSPGCLLGSFVSRTRGSRVCDRFVGSQDHLRLRASQAVCV